MVAKNLPALSADQIKTATLAVQGGLGKRKALRRAGISTADFKRIEELGQQGLQPYASFLQGLDAAALDLEAALIAKVMASSDWRSAMRMLESLAEDTWGPKIKIEVQREVDHIIDLAEKILDPAQFALFVTALSESGQGEDDPPTAGQQPVGGLPN